MSKTLINRIDTAFSFLKENRKVSQKLALHHSIMLSILRKIVSGEKVFARNDIDIIFNGKQRKVVGKYIPNAKREYISDEIVIRDTLERVIKELSLFLYIEKNNKRIADRGHSLIVVVVFNDDIKSLVHHHYAEVFDLRMLMYFRD